MNILITGGNKGLGLELAKSYACSGHRVCISVRNQLRLSNFLNTKDGQELQSFDVEFFVCDLSNKNHLNKLYNEVGAVDVLINCAGVFPVKSLFDTTIEQYNECIDVNLTAPFMLCQLFAKDMIKSGWGRIINIGSSSAYGGSPQTSAYCASKHGILGLSRSLFKELKDYGVRVICVSPGTIKTDMGKEVEKLGQDYDTFIDPKELADYIVYNTFLNDNMISEEIRLNRVSIQ